LAATRHVPGALITPKCGKRKRIFGSHEFRTRERVWQGRSQRRGQGAMPHAPSNRRLRGFFTGKKLAKVTLFSLPEVFWGLQICQKCVGSRGSAPDPAGKAHDAPPNPL